MAGLDLHDVGSVDELLERVRRYVDRDPGRGVVLGQGWDERSWPDPRPPTRAELDEAGRGRAGLPRPRRRALRGRVDRAAGRAARRRRPRRLPARRAAEPGRAPRLPRAARPADHRRRTTPRRRGRPARRPPRSASARCTSSADRTSGRWPTSPGSSTPGARPASAWCRTGASWRATRRSPGWPRSAPAGSPATCASTGRSGRGRRRCVDDYSDGPGRGAQYLDLDAVVEHLRACTERGVSGGFHCIGDAGVATAVEGLRRVARAARRRPRPGGPAPPRARRDGRGGGPAGARPARGDGERAARLRRRLGRARRALRRARRRAGRDDEPLRLDAARRGARWRSGPTRP